MRRKGTSEQLAIVRNRGLALLEQGKKPKEVAEILTECNASLCMSVASRKQEAETKKGNSPARTTKKNNRETSQKT